MEDTIIDAISRRIVLRFRYEDQIRIVNPHALYREERFAKRVLHAWQTDGGSNTRNPPCWGNFHLDKIIGLMMSGETFFGAQWDYNPGRFRHIIHSI